MSQRYWQLPGVRYVYTTEVSVACPLWDASQALGKGEALPAELQPLWDAAAALDVDMTRMVHRVHSTWSLSGSDGRCRACGAPLRRLGYAAWIERDLPQDAGVGAMLAAGVVSEPFSGRRYRIERFARHKLRREAKAWAWEQYLVDRDTARAEARS